MKMTINPVFDFGDVVFVKTDTEQTEGMVTELTILPGGIIMYIVSKDALLASFYDFELSDSKDVKKM